MQFDQYRPGEHHVTKYDSAVGFFHDVLHRHDVEHHHTAAGHILICPTNDCYGFFDDPPHYKYDFGPAVHDHNKPAVDD